MLVNDYIGGIYIKTTFIRYRWQTYTLSIIIFIVLLVLPFSTRKTVKEDGLYYDYKDVSLYVYKYDKLPSNFITKSQAEYLFGNYYDAVDQGYNIGGDVYLYMGAITQITENQDLRESDIYPDRNAVVTNSSRGSYRLIYTLDGSDVFYTTDHYATIDHVSSGEIQSTSILFSILFFVYFGNFLFFYFVLVKKEILSKEELKKDVLLIGKIIISLIVLPAKYLVIVFSFVRLVIAKHKSS